MYKILTKAGSKVRVITDFIAPAGLKILAWNGNEWRDVEYANEIS